MYTFYKRNLYYSVRKLFTASNFSKNLSPLNYYCTQSQEKIIPVIGVSSKKFSNGSKSTFSSEEVNKFRDLSQSWWDREGAFKPLHSLNKLRISLIRDGLIQSGIADSNFTEGPHPLKDIKILDVGCGGGILCEPLARLGASVTGIDAAEEGIMAARNHSVLDENLSSRLRYVYGTIEELASDSNSLFDCLVVSEVLEHIDDVEFFLSTCVSLIKPGGSLFITTINRTLKSYLAAIVAAEYVLGIVPTGTHQWDKFIQPEELTVLLERNGMGLRLCHGMFYMPVKDEWCWINDSSVNYALHAIKNNERVTS